MKVRPRANGMTARSTALPHGLLSDDVLRAVRYRGGYIDLLGPSAPARLSLVDPRGKYRGAAVRAEVPAFARPLAAVDQLVVGLP